MDNPLIYIVDDDVAVRESLALLLGLRDFRTRQLSSAREFLTNFDRTEPAIALFDIQMPEMSGLELQHEVARRGIDLPIIFITGHGDVPQAVKAMKAGAVDMLQKPFSTERLIECIDLAISRIGEKKEQQMHVADLQQRIETLTPRERQVVRLVSEGLTSKAVAERLHISARTVDIYRAAAIEKLKVNNTVELVRLVLEIGVEKLGSASRA